MYVMFSKCFEIFREVCKKSLNETNSVLKGSNFASALQRVILKAGGGCLLLLPTGNALH